MNLRAVLVPWVIGCGMSVEDHEAFLSRNTLAAEEAGEGSFAPPALSRSGDGHVEVVTFGCRLNTYESEAMRAQALAAGFKNTIIVNTCTVTAEAARQARQTIRRLRRERPDANIVVTGCAVQVEPERFAAMAEVNHVVGNDRKLKADTWEGLVQSHDKLLVGDIMQVRETAMHLVDGFEGKARAFVQVQNGCDHRCTFCIIPYGRGPSRSVPMGQVVEQVQLLVARGYAEVVLTGVDLTSYGHDLPGRPVLGTLTRALLRHVPDLPRLRISSIDAVEMDDDLWRAWADEERLMPHLHLSLQAGDNMILKRMKRRHLREDAIAFCQRARSLRPDAIFGADIIAGFPTETEAMFENSLAIVDECELTHLHVFPYSPREGTPAARMPMLPKAVIKERAARLRKKGQEALLRHLQAQLGQQAQVLVESPLMGRLPGFTPVKLPSPMPVGVLAHVSLVGHDDRQFFAEMAS